LKREDKKRLGFEKNKKEKDKFRLRTPYTTDFTPQSHKLKPQEI